MVIKQKNLLHCSPIIALTFCAVIELMGALINSLFLSFASPIRRFCKDILTPASKILDVNVPLPNNFPSSLKKTPSSWDSTPSNSPELNPSVLLSTS